MYHTAVNTTGLSALNLSFKYELDDWSGSNTIRLKFSTVQMVTTWFDTDWSAAGGSNLLARTVNTTLTKTDHGVGASTYYIAFVFDGDMGDINYWYIDDVQLATVNSFNNLVVDKSNADVIMEGGIVINNDLTIPSGHGANVILNPTARLTVNGSLNNSSGNDGLEFKSNATSTASLIHNTNGVDARVERYYSGTPQISDWCYHMTCVPVNEAILYDFNGSPGNTFAYNYVPTNSDGGDVPTNQTNIENITDGSSTIESMRGIILSTSDETSFTSVFNDDLMNGNLPVTTVAGNWILVGNPYPSPVSWESLYRNNNVFPTVYVHDPSAGNFASYNIESGEGLLTWESCQYIQMGQSFFVKSLDGSDFTFTNADRIHTDGVAYLKNGRDESVNIPNRLVLNTSGGTNTYDNAIILFDEAGSESYDEMLGIIKSFSIYKEDATELWSMSSDNVNLGVNIMPELALDKSYSIPLHFKAGSVICIVLLPAILDSFDEETTIEIEDRTLASDNFFDLKANPEYSFMANPTDDYDRFILHFNREIIGIDESTSQISNIRIFSSNNQITIINKSDSKEIDVQVLNINGQIVRNLDKLYGEYNTFTCNNVPGIYIVKVVAGNSVITEKVFVR